MMSHPQETTPLRPAKAAPTYTNVAKLKNILNNDNKIHDDEAGAIKIRKNALRVF